MKLPKISSRLPTKIVLKKDTLFTLRDEDGKTVGMVSIKAGTTLKLIEVKPEHAIVAVSSSISPVPVENTTLVEQLGGSDAVLEMPDDSPATHEEKPESKKTPSPPATGSSKKA